VGHVAQMRQVKWKNTSCSFETSWNDTEHRCRIGSCRNNKDAESVFKPFTSSHLCEI